MLEVKVSEPKSDVGRCVGKKLSNIQERFPSTSRCLLTPDPWPYLPPSPAAPGSCLRVLSGKVNSPCQ